MRFRTWMEEEASLGSGMPDMYSISGRGSDTPASNAVKLTGLQPQVGAQEIQTKQKDEQDKISAIDSGIENIDKNLPDGDAMEFPKINQFKKAWDKLKQRWQDIKSDTSDLHDNREGLGFTQGNEKYVNMSREHPNMVPRWGGYPPGPGTWGVS